MTFATDFVFSRGTGKTRVNRAGLLVGVDFSASSVTFGTGSRNFILAADASVNRDWVIGSKVIVVSQVAPLGSMEGTVAAYNPATQSLTVDVTTNTGTGTSANWRIGSLELTRDLASGGLESHPGATNLALFSEDFTNAAWVKTNGVVTGNTFAAPNGSLHADTLSATGANATFLQAYSAALGQYYTEQLWLARKSGTGVVEITADGVTYTPVILTNSLQRFDVATTAQSAVTRSFGVRIVTTGDEVYAFGNNFLNGSIGPYIPTNVAQVTRAADSFVLSASAVARIASEGTLYAEVETADVGPAQKRAMRLFGPDRDIRIAKRGIGSFAGFTKQIEIDNVLYFGNALANSQRDDGKEFSSIVATVNERTGLPDTVGAVAAWSYNGTDNIGYATQSEERFLSKNLALWSGKGAGSSELRKGAFIGSRFVIPTLTVGTVFIASSSGYRRVNTPVLAQPMRSIASNGSRLVGVGDNGFIAYSDDQGETWVTAGINNAGTTVNFGSVIFAAGLFVATRAANQNGQNIITSPDGVTWTARTKAGGTNDVAYNGTNLFVAVGPGGTVYTSPEAINWTVQNSGTTNGLTGVHFANSLWVAVGTAGTIITSPNGTTWTTRTSGVSTNLNDVTYFNSQFVVAGNSNVILTSLNGTAWTSRTSNVVSTLVGVFESGGLVVATGTSGALTVSTDAITWVPLTNNTSTIEGMAYGSDTYYSAGTNSGGSGYIAKINNLGEISRVQGVPNQSYFSAKFLRGLFFFTGAGSSIYKITVAGVKEALTVGGTSFTIRDIADSGALMVAVGSGGRFTTSTDGSVFANSALVGIGNVQLNGISHAMDTFVTVGNGGAILTSQNGAAWTSRVSGTTQNLNSIMYSLRDSLWYAAGANGTLLFSPDAITWQPVQNSGFGSVSVSELQAAQLLSQFRPGRNRLAISYKENQVITSLNGVSKVDTLAALPNFITGGAMGENLNGFIARMKVQAEALSEFELNAMTGL